MGCDITFKIGNSEVLKQQNTSLTPETATLANIVNQVLTPQHKNTLIQELTKNIIDKNWSVDKLPTNSETNQRVISNYSFEELKSIYPEIFRDLPHIDYIPEILLVNYLKINAKRYENIIYSQNKDSRIFVVSPTNLWNFKNYLILKQAIIDKCKDQSYVEQIKGKLTGLISEKFEDSRGNKFSSYQDLLIDFIENRNYYSKKSGLFGALIQICNELAEKKSRLVLDSEIELYTIRNNLSPTRFINWATKYFPEACSEETNIALKNVHTTLGDNFKTAHKVVPIWEAIQEQLRNNPDHRLLFTLNSKCIEDLQNGKKGVMISFNDETSEIKGLYEYSFNTINEHFVETGKYRDFSIYRDTNSNTYVVSKFSLSPDTKVVQFASEQEAQEYIDSKYNAESIKIKDYFDLGFYKNTSEALNYIYSVHWVPNNQVVSRLDISINNSIPTTSQLYPLLETGTLSDFYKWIDETFSEDQDNIKNTIQSAEQAGIFLHLYNDGDHNSKSLINKIRNAQRKFYLVTSCTGKSGNYKLHYIPIETMTPKYSEKFSRPQPIISELEQLASILNNKGIPIHILTTSEMEQYKDIIEDTSPKAFIYNGEVYINGDKATSKDLLHEYAHLLLGVLKASNFELYQNLLERTMQLQKAKYKLEYLKEAYKHRATPDIQEEVFAELFGEFMEGFHNEDPLQETSQEVLQQWQSIFNYGENEELTGQYVKYNVSAKSFFTQFCKDVHTAGDLDFKKGTIYRQAANKIEKDIKDNKIIEKCK